ncbi:MAG: excinuclease ABC subunit UvrC [Oscillospiraceae bacterium]
MTKQELYNKAKMLPLLPGVYIIRDASDVVVYVGKAKRLRTRVSQYFREGVPHDAKVTRMIAAARSFDVIVTGSEFEALVLECSQIKQHSPHYNILLKDDKGYSYIKVTKGDWPRITAELQKGEDDAEYIGPFISSFAVRQMVQTVNDSFLLPRCARRFPEDIGKQRPCLYMHIGLCMGPCSGKITQPVYYQAVQDAVRMIRQGKGEIVNLLRQRMEQASEDLDFERAALLRDQIKAIEKVSAGQTVVSDGEKEQDVIAFAKGAGSACAAVLRLREGRLVDKREFMFRDTESLEDLREEFLPQYYLDEEEEIPKVIAVDAPLPDQELLSRLLSEKRGSKVRIYTPERGDNAKLIQMAYVNAAERMARETGRTSREGKALNELSGLLGLAAPPTVIESYDISNWGDGTSVCGMIVFENGRPKKAGYRRFKIKTVTGTDDYASMSEALSRRAAEYDKGATGQFGEKPDLILLDGGKGQVSVVAAVLRDTGLSDVPLFGMVKDSKHRTRGIIGVNGEEIVLSMHRGVFAFVTSIQDEVHRFSIDYQRRLAKGKALSSSLTGIPGVGPATGKALMAHFKTIKAIVAATQEELVVAKGVNKKAAAQIWAHFHEEEDA